MKPPWTLLLCACAWSWTAPGQAQVMVEELRIKGFWPDVQLSGGIGIGLDDSMDDSLMGRARLGALYAYEPYVFNLGVTGELGGLASRGIGLQFELNHFSGTWLQAGVSRVRGDDWMSQASVGWTLFGIEWQHRAERQRSSDALLFTLRAPIGIWWFLITRDPPGPPRAPPAPPPPVVEPPKPQPRTTDAEADMARIATERAAELTAEGRHADAEAQLARAYALHPQPALLLDLADAEERQGKVAAAISDLRRFLEKATVPADLAKKPEVEARLTSLREQLRSSGQSPPSESTEPPASDVSEAQ